LSKLDPQERVEVYEELFELYFSEAERLYAREELPQAGEKYWSAVASLLKAIAELEGLPHHTHRDYVEIVEHIAEKQNNPEISILFSLAEGLHANFYHSFLRKPTFSKHREGVLKLIKKLKEYLNALKLSK